LTPLVRDDFLTTLVGRPTFRVALASDGDNTAIFNAIRTVQQKPVFLYARVPTSSVDAVWQLEELGFRVVDTNVIFERAAARDRSVTRATRWARSDDRNAVMLLAAHCFTHSRLHLDPAIPRAVADRSRAEWAGNFFFGKRGDHMIVSESDGSLAGFAQLIGPRDGVLTIDLMGVGKPFRRRGIAGSLVSAASEIAGTRLLRVGTQIANTGSLRLYETLGFRVAESHYVLHFHNT
jgi:ribosomal protein S18 acetylase RimI-like enzyme